MTVVRVVFRGVMLYVRSPNRKRVTVLMPKTGTRHFGRFVKEHTPKLMIPKLVGDTITLKDSGRKLRRNIPIPFKGARSAAKTNPPPRVPDISKFCGHEKMKESILDPTKSSTKVSHRVQLLQGKPVASSAKGKMFTFGLNHEPLVDHMIWEYETDKPVVVPTTTGNFPIPQLAGVNVVFYGIFFMPDHEEDDERNHVCQEARDFHSLYSFFREPSVEIPRHHPGARISSAADGPNAHEEDLGRARGGEVNAGVVTTETILDAFLRSDPVTCVGGGFGGG